MLKSIRMAKTYKNVLIFRDVLLINAVFKGCAGTKRRIDAYRGYRRYDRKNRIPAREGCHAGIEKQYRKNYSQTNVRKSRLTYSDIKTAVTQMNTSPKVECANKEYIEPGKTPSYV